MAACGPDPTAPVPASLSVAFVSRSGIPALRLASPDGAVQRTVAVPLGSFGQPSWSPDGARLAVIGAASAGRSAVAVVDVGTGRSFTVGGAAVGERPMGTTYDWSPDGKALAVVRSSYDIRVPPQCGREVHLTTVAAEPEGAPEREVLRLAGCARPLERVDVLRWGTGGRLYVASQRPDRAPGAELARVVAIDTATGAVRVVRDSVAGAVQAIARDGTWALVLRDPVEDRRFLKFAGDYRQLVRVDLATGAPAVLVDSTRLPVPLYLPGDPRLPNDRLRWARLTADDRQIVVGLNVEQGDVWGTRLVYHALTSAGAPARALAVTPGSPEDVVTLRP